MDSEFYPNLRAIAALYPETIHIVARKASGIRAVRDLRGKKVSLDEPGSGTLVDARIVLKAHGLSEDDLEPEYVKPTLASERIRAGALDAFFIVAGHPVTSVKLFPIEGCRAEDMPGELLKNADTAMYRAKAAGRDTIKFFANSMQQAANRKLALQGVIQRGLGRDQFRFEFQPQVDLEGRVGGFEALLRLDTSELDEIRTDEIIEVAEESGLIVPLGDWVVMRACRLLKRWADDMVDLKRLSINVSPRQFHLNDFVDRVIRILAETGADSTGLEMESSEGTVMMNVESAIEKMQALKHLGIRFAMDDFGTGYSSLAYLKRLPLDRIKFDQSFTRDVVSDPNDAVIVETIISMAESLDLEVIAEGVETSEAFSALKTRSCTVFQGYYFSYPVDERGLVEILRTGLKPARSNVRSIRDAESKAL